MHRDRDRGLSIVAALMALALTGCGKSRDTQVPQLAEPEAELSASPSEVEAGEAVVLRWSSARAETLELQPGLGPVAASGSLTVYPQQTTEYRLVVRGHEGATLTRQAQVRVRPARGVRIRAQPARARRR
jgi:hypothetical protein